MVLKIKCVVVLNFFLLAHCAYPPTGDEVVPGSVLLPATRRGRYLANIVRRQAVDGTGIKFNKDADRMNAEAKKKVDVLSEELLPYIIAEQDRRVTLHARIMSAIQNGEKGITIAEMRNKSPLLIRKGNLYRCPLNRGPIEPDGSGIMMCEDNITPTQIIYDSCLSAEDRPLYYTTVNSQNRYFFCDRQRVEGADLPHTNNGTVVACHPTIRTSLNYTMQKCALEDTDDVVVHFRYYPDRTYKYVTELDPDREMCDHWNPCQIGYIFSLPLMDQAKKAEEFYPNDYNEMWHGDEDSMDEGISPSLKEYQASTRRVIIPEGYTYEGVRFQDPNGQWKKLSSSHIEAHTERPHVGVGTRQAGIMWLILSFPKWKATFYGQYYVVCKKGKHEKLVHFLNLVQVSTYAVSKTVEVIISQTRNETKVPFVCNRCLVKGITIRCEDDQVYNFNTSRYRIEDSPQQQFSFDLDNIGSHEKGFYFAVIKNGDGFEERILILRVQVVKVNRLELSFDVGAHYDRSLNYQCDNCRPTDVLCNGKSATAAGRVYINPPKREVNFNFPNFQDSNACVYVGFFRVNRNNMLFKILAVVDTVKVTKDVVPPPNNGEIFQHIIGYTCQLCTVLRVYVNGLEIEREPKTLRNNVGLSTFESTPSSLTIHVAEFGPAYEGVYQAIFDVKGEEVTKSVLEVREPGASPNATAAKQLTENNQPERYRKAMDLPSDEARVPSTGTTIEPTTETTTETTIEMTTETMTTS